MTETPDRYASLAALAEAAGWERKPLTFNGANFRRRDLRVRMVHEGDPGALLVKATYEKSGYRIAELHVQLGEVPAPTTRRMVELFLNQVSTLARPEIPCAANGCGEAIVTSTEGGWVHARTGQRQCDLVQSGRPPSYAHPEEPER